MSVSSSAGEEDVLVRGKCVETGFQSKSEKEQQRCELPQHGWVHVPVLLRP